MNSEQHLNISQTNKLIFDDSSSVKVNNFNFNEVLIHMDIYNTKKYWQGIKYIINFIFVEMGTYTQYVSFFYVFISVESFDYFHFHFSQKKYIIPKSQEILTSTFKLFHFMNFVPDTIFLPLYIKLQHPICCFQNYALYNFWVDFQPSSKNQSKNV